MKNLVLLLLSIAILISCDKKDDATPALSTSKLVGTWTSVSSQTVMTVGDMSYVEYLVSLGIPEDMAIEFADQMADLLTLSGFYAEMQIKNDFTWSGDSEFVTTPVTGKWELSADEKTLTLTNDAAPGEIQKGTITKLDDTDLWIEVGVDKSTLPPGTPTNFDYTAVLKFTRKK